MDDSAFKSQLAGLIPHMRAFARNLCGDPVLADDLAQDAMLKAWEGRSAYREGSNMKAWCFTILRNVFYSEKRRSWRVQALEPGTADPAPRPAMPAGRPARSPDPRGRGRHDL